MEKIVLLLALFIVTVISQVKAVISLPDFFDDDMILQQQSDVAIWGWAKPNATVKVTTSWNKKRYSTKSNDKGAWRLKVRTPEAGYTPYTITISDGKSVVLNGVLIGEVWLCSGQSNMAMSFRGYQGQPVEEATEAVMNPNPYIHYFKVERTARVLPQDMCNGKWLKSNIQTLPDLTAVGYFFARMIQSQLDVPIGLIQTAWEGSSIQTWMSENALKAFPDMKIPVSQEDVEVPVATPTVLYNGMIHPLIGYGIRGVLWYQGGVQYFQTPKVYSQMFETMIAEWRTLWGQGDFPFYYCQIAPYDYGTTNSAYLREVQLKSQNIKNTGMAVLMDSDSPECIHPPKKKMAGERMALWALTKTYGKNGIHYRSPELISAKAEGMVMVLTFDVENHPELTAHGKEIRNFQVAGEDRHFYPAKADFVGNMIYLFSSSVGKPVAVRYCFDNTSASEIFSVEGNLPISSFRTDEW